MPGEIASNPETSKLQPATSARLPFIKNISKKPEGV